MRKIISLMVSLALVTAIIFPAKAADGYNLVPVNEYSTEKFKDVDESAWYAEAVKTVYRYGFMTGVGEETFNPDGKITLAETLALASRLYAIYHEDDPDFPEGETWYEPYVKYSISNGIINKGGFNNYLKQASRVQFAEIIVAALPEEVVSEINIIEDGMIPDVKLSDKGGLAVYTLYRAGILTGTDKYGRYLPQEQITRSAVATIITNIINSDCRKSFMPEPLPIQVVSLQLNTTSQSIYIGDTAKLTCSMIPNNAEDKRVTWTTSNSKVASVSGGVVTGVGKAPLKFE